MFRFENALREMDPGVTLPYWDTSLDNELTDPRLSNMWTDKFMGTASGIVTNGPAARWRTNAGTSLIRNVGGSTQLISRNDIANVMSQSYTQDISVPTAGPSSDLEGLHGTIHTWVGGDMMNLPTAANDPLFWMHHAFIDCVWENFRQMQESMGVNSATDYPRIYGSEVHNPYRKLGFGNMRNIDSYSRNFTALYECEAAPTCSENVPTCDSPYLTCNTTTYACVPTTPPEPDSTDPVTQPSCSDPPTPPMYQNSYCIDGVCDVSEWAYVPVHVIYSRPPKVNASSAYPIKNNEANTSSDIYAPETYGGVYKYRSSKQETPTDRCLRQKSRGTAGSIAVETTGISYQGFYREYSVIDQRLPISSSTTYVAIKNPAKGHSKALVRAYDECGRICRPVCRDAMTERITPCSGVIEASMQDPMQFGNDYESATYETWNYDDPDFPMYIGNNAFLTFYCDNTGTFPWKDYGNMSSPPTTTSTYRSNATTTTGPAYNPQKETTRHPYDPNTTPTTRKTYPSKTTTNSPYDAQSEPTTKSEYQHKTTKPSYMTETTTQPYVTTTESTTASKTTKPSYMTETTKKAYYSQTRRPRTTKKSYITRTTTPTTTSQPYYQQKTTKSPYMEMPTTTPPAPGNVFPVKYIMFSAI